MPIKRVRLELARDPEHPEGSANHGYEFIAPLTVDGHLDLDEWRRDPPSGWRVRRFWRGEPDLHGHLVHHRGGRWAFRYDDMPEVGEEPIFRFEQHSFVEGEYASITEYDGVQRTFRIVSVRDEE